jgi:hypothetical protein
MVREALFSIALLVSSSGIMQDQRRKHGFHFCAKILATQVYNKEVVPTDLLSLQRNAASLLILTRSRFDSMN